MQQRIKEVFTDYFANYNTFTRETYKLVRNRGKKLEDISKIEEKLANKVKITEEQKQKLTLKQEHLNFVAHTLDIMEMYKGEVDREILLAQQREAELQQEQASAQDQHHHQTQNEETQVQATPDEQETNAQSHEEAQDSHPVSH